MKTKKRRTSEMQGRGENHPGDHLISMELLRSGSQKGNSPTSIRKEKYNQCQCLIAANSSGTTSFAISCLRKHEETTDDQSVHPGASNDGSRSLTNWKFDQQKIRLALCKIIIHNELSFRFVEREGFKKFAARVCPTFKIPSRKTIGEDSVRLFVEQKESLKSFLMKESMGRVSLTIDNWSAINKTNVVRVTAHFISKNWELQKKIISFRKVLHHKGDDIGDSIITSLDEWDMKRIICCTTGNSSANDETVRYIRDKLDLWGTNILGGKYLHLHCVAHIINLVVSDILEEIGMSVRRVREAVKWIKASPTRNEQFILCMEMLKVGCKESLCLDVPTRWNSTYLMLESAEPYEAVFKLYELKSSTFVAELKQKRYKDSPIGPPEADDWINVRMMIEYLRKFYDLTRLVSSTTHVTVHLFFKEMCDLFDLISELERHEDAGISSMASKIRVKVGEYWLEAEELNPNLNKILYIAALLDPRQKMKHVEKCLKKVYGVDRAAELTRELRESMNEMFEFYKTNLTPTPITNTSEASTASQNQQFDIQRRSTSRASCRTMQDSSEEEPEDHDSSELTLYFTEKQFKEPKLAANETAVVDTFDVLKWWSTHGLPFPILSEIARDILAIPLSSVASESAFSMRGRALEAFRSTLNPKMAEALICSEDWLRSNSTYKKDEEDLHEEELKCSSKTYVKSPPMELAKLRLVNGSVKEGPTGSRGKGRVEEGRGVRPERETRKNTRKNDGMVMSKAGEDDELVDGWPKWLVDNIPSYVLKNIVPKSADSYTKIDKVGQGTYSNVYKARDRESGKLVALKKVRFDTSEAESVKFMAREIMILQKLDHANILKLEGLATSRMQYSLYLVFDYMYSDLSRILSRPDERLTEPQIKCYMHQLLSGLQHCHEKGILHRDIKGSNLLIDRNGMLKVGDFGLANVYNPEKRRPLTSRVVTLWYRAPELLLGSTDYGVGIDLWSVGCLMAEMYAGRPIMPARTEVEQLHRIFKLCGSPKDDYYRRFKLSTALKPPQIYKPNLREAFKNFPAPAVDLLSTLLSLDPGCRGTAASALQDKFFQISPLACDISGLPAIHVEEDDYSAATEMRKHRTSKLRRRSQTQREQRKKSSPVQKPSADNNEGSKETSTDSSIFGLDPGSSSTSTSSTSVRPSGNEEGPPQLFPSPVAPDEEVSKNIKNRPPIPTSKSRAINYYKVQDGPNRLDSVQRSASSRAFGSLEKKHILKLHALDD